MQPALASSRLIEQSHSQNGKQITKSYAGWIALLFHQTLFENILKLFSLGVTSADSNQPWALGF